MTVNIIGAGTCTITASQAGDATYAVATPVNQAVTINAASQTISFTSIAPAATVGGATYTPTATASSGLTVVFTIDASSTSVCSISGGVVSFLTAGTCTINANQAGNATYSAAAQVQQAVTVSINIAIIDVVSSKSHGSYVGEIGIPFGGTLAVPGAIEPRLALTGHTIVFRFNAPVSVAGSVSVTTAPASSASGTAAVSLANPNHVIVTLTGIADAARAQISLQGVNGAVNQTVALGFLVGDVSGNGRVTATDIAAVKVNSGLPAGANNFRADLNASGSVTAPDISIIKSRSGTQLP